MINSDISVFQNPNDGSFFVESDLVGVSYTVHDFSGRIVHRGILSHHRTSVSMDHLSPGLYFLRAEDDLGISGIQIVIK